MKREKKKEKKIHGHTLSCPCINCQFSLSFLYEGFNSSLKYLILAVILSCRCKNILNLLTTERHMERLEFWYFSFMKFEPLCSTGKVVGAHVIFNSQHQNTPVLH